MYISKNDFCPKCRNIRVSLGGGRPAGQALYEVEGNQMLAFMAYRAMLTDLKNNGGCPKCIGLLENATS